MGVKMSRAQKGPGAAASATLVHGISYRKVKDAPRMEDVAPELLVELEGKVVAAYNRDFDFRIISQTLRRCGFYERLYHPGRRRKRKQEHLDLESACIMRMYASYVGEWNDYYGNYKWHKLGDAANQCGIDFTGRQHSALVDARATLGILRHLAMSEP